MNVLSLQIRFLVRFLDSCRMNLGREKGFKQLLVALELLLLCWWEVLTRFVGEGLLLLLFFLSFCLAHYWLDGSLERWLRIECPSRGPFQHQYPHAVVYSSRGSSVLCWPMHAHSPSRTKTNGTHTYINISTNLKRIDWGLALDWDMIPVLSSLGFIFVCLFVFWPVSKYL